MNARAWIAVWAAATAVSAQTPPPSGAAAKPADPGGVLVRLVKGEQAVREVVLVRREESTIFFRLTNSPPGVLSSFEPSQVDEADFRLAIPEQQAYAEATQRRWLDAARRLHGAIAPALPYLDLPRNNVFEPAVAAAWYYVRAAQQSARKGEAGRPEAVRLFGEAQKLFSAAGRAASWHPYGEPAGIRAFLCWIEVGRLDEAEAGLARQREPEVGDAAWGVYWLARAHLLYARERPRPALDAVILSILHENKDVETFPDALMLSGQCYEDVNEPHRARDVYYEVARLFPGTDWGDEARLRLATMMDLGMTATPEDPNISGIFFGTEENMNELAQKYLKESEPKTAPPAQGESKP